MKFDHKIAAIKALREASMLKVEVYWDPNLQQHIIKQVRPNGETGTSIGLREAKEIIEAAMELGIQQAQVNELRNERIRMEDFLRNLSAQLQTEANILEDKRMGGDGNGGRS